VNYSTVPIFGELGQISQIRISSYLFINYRQLLVKFSARSEHFSFRGSKGLIFDAKLPHLFPSSVCCELCARRISRASIYRPRHININGFHIGCWQVFCPRPPLDYFVSKRHYSKVTDRKLKGIAD
jgi:hypothetical protein